MSSSPARASRDETPTLSRTSTDVQRQQAIAAAESRSEAAPECHALACHCPAFGNEAASPEEAWLCPGCALLPARAVHAVPIRIVTPVGRLGAVAILADVGRGRRLVDAAGSGG